MTSPMPTVSMFISTAGSVAGVSMKKKLISSPTMTALQSTGGSEAGMASPLMRAWRR